MSDADGASDIVDGCMDEYSKYSPVTLANVESESAKTVLRRIDEGLLELKEEPQVVTDDFVYDWLTLHLDILEMGEFPEDEWYGSTLTRYCVIDLLWRYHETEKNAECPEQVINSCRRVVHGIQSVDSARELYLTPEVPMTEINSSDELEGE